MENIDWSKAPEGATSHGYAGPQLIEVWVNKEQYTYCDGRQHGAVFDFGKSACHRNNEEVVNRTSRPPPWNGQGLPPVGTVCEWKEKTGFQWVSAEVLFISESSVVMKRADGYEWQMMTARTAFRPIRTPEQIAADERDESVISVFRLIRENGWDIRSDDADYLYFLYDSGLLKKAS